MRHWVSGSILVVAACLWASALAAQNLVVNGGFEELADDGGPAGWSFEGVGQMAPGAAGLVRAAHSGAAALGIASKFHLVDYSARSDCFELGGAHELLVSAYYHTQRTPRATMALATFREPVRGSLWQTPPVQLEYHALAAAKAWQLACSRFRLSPAARHGVLLFRIRGEGALTVDDVTVGQHPDKVEAELLVPGLIERLPSRRLLQARVRNLAMFRLQAVAELAVTPAKGKSETHSAPFELDAGAETLVDIPYSFDAKQRHEATLTFLDSARERVLDHIAFEAPALLELHATVPAFRSCILSTLRPETCRARCRMNAMESVLQGVELTAVLRDARKDGTELGVSVTDAANKGEWELRVPARSLGPGRYELEAAASARHGRIATTQTPLWVLEPRRWEVGYDEHGVLNISGRAVFPVGVLGVEDPDMLKGLAAGGLNCVVTPGDAVRLDFLDEAHLRGLKVIIVLQPPMVPGLPGAVQRLAAHPALLGWYVPSAPGQSPDEVAAVAELQSRLADWDPYHPVIGLLSDGWLWPRQGSAADVVLAASPPVTYWPLATLAEQLDAARQAPTAAGAAWAAVQTDGLAWRVGQALSKSGDGRPPTPEELRCMVYLAIAHGARGVLYTAYYTHAHRGVPELLLPRDCPELWQAVVQTNRELQELAPALLAPTAARRLQAEPPGVHAALIGEASRQVLIAINPTGENLEARIALPASLPAVRPYGADDPLPELQDHTLYTTLAPRTVRLFRAVAEMPKQRRTADSG